MIEMTIATRKFVWQDPRRLAIVKSRIEGLTFGAIAEQWLITDARVKVIFDRTVRSLQTTAAIRIAANPQQVEGRREARDLLEALQATRNLRRSGDHEDFLHDYQGEKYWGD